MAQKETNIVHEIQAVASKSGNRLWKNVRGMFMTKSGHPIKVGLMAAGASDLIGFTIVEVTPDMVGNLVPVFTAIEVKTSTGSASEDQMSFISFVKSVGGIADVARSSDDYLRVLGRS